MHASVEMSTIDLLYFIYLNASFAETLSPEVVKYLWDNLCHVLPDALYDTGEMLSKNPIHFLSHSILKNKYVYLFVSIIKLATSPDSFLAATVSWAPKNCKRLPTTTTNF